MKKRILWLDLVKVYAIFSVILLHVATSITTQFDKVSLTDWNIANAYESTVRMAVPLFFMVTGALLLNAREESLSIFFSKRFSKIAIPLLAWSFFYILFRKYAWHQDIDIVDHMIEALYKEQIVPLWFLYTLVGLYLFIPILKIFIKNSSRSMQIYFVVLWIIVVSIIPLVNKFSALDIPNHMPMMTGDVGFLVLGYLLFQVEVNKKIFIMALVLIVVSTFITYFGTAYLSMNADKFQDFFYGRFSLNTVIQAISFFIALKYIGEKISSSNGIASHIITQLGLASFGIYLIHSFTEWVLIRTIGLYALNGYNPVYVIPITALANFILSFIAIYIMRKIPIVKNIVP